jgi:pilus assembly protein FimV
VQPVAEIVEKGTSYLNIMLGSLAILLLAIGGFFSWRKRQAELQNIFKATDSTVLAASSEATKEDEVVVLATPVEASFDTKTTEHIKVKEEVMDDVLLDADTYLAYGKYDEAEKSLRQELKVSPYKDSYKLKLLEVFYSSENSRFKYVL